jgi:hypothetical protein
VAKKDSNAKNEVEVDEKPRETTVEFLSSLAAVLVTGIVHHHVCGAGV